jgi:hypothetical protein
MPLTGAPIQACVVQTPSLTGLLLSPASADGPPRGLHRQPRSVVSVGHVWFQIWARAPVGLTAGATVFLVEDSRPSASPDVRLRLIWERLGNVPP